MAVATTPYQGFAADLRAELDRRGFTLEIVEIDGSIENAQLVRDGEADIALVQSGTEVLTEVGDATDLAEVFYGPLFIFARADLPTVDGVPSLRGARINIGPAGSGTNALAQGLITLAGIPAILTTNETADSVDMLREGTIDAAVFVVAPNAPIIAELVDIPDLQLIEFDRSEAISRRRTSRRSRLGPRSSPATACIPTSRGSSWRPCRRRCRNRGSGSSTRSRRSRTRASP